MDLLQVVENGIWHAFTSLDADQHGSVPKSKLKVLTQNLATLLDCGDQRAEAGIGEFRSTPTLTYTHYKFYLTHELFVTLPDDLGCEQLRQMHQRVEDACWILYRPTALKRDLPMLPEDCVRQLFAIFCCLGELVSEPDLIQQVAMNAGEVEYVASKFVQALGRVWDSADFQQLSEIIQNFKFTIFLAFLETRYTQDMEVEALREAVGDVYDLVVGDVVKQGFLYRRADCLRRYRALWCVLTPRRIRCYRRRGDEQPVAALKLTPESRVVNLIEQSGARPNRFSVSAGGSDDDSGSTTLQLAATDYKTKFQWLSALETAVQFSGAVLGYQRHLAVERRAAWHEAAARQHEDDRRRLSQVQCMDSTQAELEAERLARAAAEAQAAELAQRQEAEARRLAQLEDTRLELERLLHEEKQAKRDEELVRSAQSRVLRQEWEKREDLERLQAELTSMLDEERQKREAFEVMQKQKQRELEDAQLRLREVEEDRVKLDHELKSARFKLMIAERTKGAVESKLRVREREVSLRGDNGVAGSLSPGSMLPLRSASFREPRELSRLTSSSSFRAELNNNRCAAVPRVSSTSSTASDRCEAVPRVGSTGSTASDQSAPEEVGRSPSPESQTPPSS